MEFSESPLVSVVTATYNMSCYVAEAVDSVLAQTYPNLEVIIVDDGSTDGTMESLARYKNDFRVHIIRQENQGQTAAKNRGLREARGKFIGFCDADDRWRPEKLARQLPAFHGRPELGVVYAYFECIDEDGQATDTPSWICHSGRITGKLLADNFVHFPTTVVRREAIESVGGFDESLTMGIDFDLWLRISVDWEFLYLPEILVDYRVWEGQMSHRTGERFDNAFRIMGRHLAEHPTTVSPAERRYAWAYTYASRACWHARNRRALPSAADFLRAACWRPWDERLWRCVVRALFGRL